MALFGNFCIKMMTEVSSCSAKFELLRYKNNMTEQTINRIRKFTADRDWDQFHTPANLAKSISIEANELLECFQWSDKDYDLEHVKEELADVMVYCRNLLDKLDLDEDEIINMKMTMNEAKYPVEKAKGSNKKYTEL
ncbi:MAG: nucleotide pyrophosphohydrolase [Treponema succinifaciens]|nr:MAG: nucleotide pyrophosphohydrolase [Treponema succinifaciens]